MCRAGNMPPITADCRLPTADYTARAPLRVSFGGGGTDLAAYYERFGGFVVSAALARYCRVTAGPSGDGGVHIHSADYGVRERYGRGELPPVEGPLALPKAAVAHFWERGLRQEGVALSLAAPVPPGTGLGSSSAMTVALIRALAAYLGQTLSADEVADLACCLEIERLGMPIGRQDQYASAFGGLNTIEFAAHGVRVTPLKLPVGVAAALQQRLLLFSTGRSHDSAKILRRQQADSRANPAVVASLHRIKALALEMREALIAGDLDGFGNLLDRGWHEKRGLSSAISSDSIDHYYAAARQAGALGGKITGAGGGGFLLLYCPPQAQRALRAAMNGCGLREMTCRFDWTGATVRHSTRAYAANETGAQTTARPPATAYQQAAPRTPPAWPASSLVATATKQEGKDLS